MDTKRFVSSCKFIISSFIMVNGFLQIVETPIPTIQQQSFYKMRVIVKHCKDQCFKILCPSDFFINKCDTQWHVFSMHGTITPCIQPCPIHFLICLLSILRVYTQEKTQFCIFFRSLKTNLQIHAHQLLILVLDIPINWTQDHTIGACQSLKNPVAHINGGLYIYI